MDKAQKLLLIKRSLALKHKLKVVETMPEPESHDELSIWLLARWEYEDELQAVNQLLAEARGENVSSKKRQLEKSSKMPIKNESQPQGNGE